MMLLAHWFALVLVAADGPAQQPPTVPAVPAADAIWHLTLPEAIRISLVNSEIVRVLDAEIRTIRVGEREVPIGASEPDLAGPVVAAGRAARRQPDDPPGEVPPPGVGPHGVGVRIARLDADASVWAFKEAVEAHVRSVEQQYWALAALQVNLWSRETAVRLGEEILRSEQADEAAGNGRSRPNVKEAEERLAAFKRDEATATTDLGDAGWRLRSILGLPATDGRRIVAVTDPVEAKHEVDRASSLRLLLTCRPDVLQQREVVADLSLLEAVAARPEAQAQARDRREGQQDQLNTLVRRATAGLDWSIAAIAAGHKEFHASRDARADVQGRLEVQRGYYGEGRINAIVLLDTVARFADAISQEALAKCTYSTAIASFEEVRGTLLAADGIALGPGIAPPRGAPAAPAAGR